MAHDWWIDHSNKQYTLHQGHAYSTHGGATVVTYPANIVKTVLCTTPASTVKLLSFSHTHPVTFTGECDAVLIRLSSGYWTKTPWGAQNLPKTGMTSVLKSWRSEESIQRINRWQASGKKVLGKGLAVTPVTDPFRVNVGDKILVIVTLDGKPVTNVPVAYQSDTRGTTDKEGHIALRIRQAGIQLISASLETPLDDGKADTLVRTAHLQFELMK